MRVKKPRGNRGLGSLGRLVRLLARFDLAGRRRFRWGFQQPLRRLFPRDIEFHPTRLWLLRHDSPKCPRRDSNPHDKRCLPSHSKCDVSAISPLRPATGPRFLRAQGRSQALYTVSMRSLQQDLATLPHEETQVLRTDYRFQLCEIMQKRCGKFDWFPLKFSPTVERDLPTW